MRIVAISDTHNQATSLNIPECDILLHCGDFSNRGTFVETTTFMYWMSSLTQVKHKVFISGNHDYMAQDKPFEFTSLVPDNITYLQDSSVVIDGIKIFGMPWTPFFYDWAFNALEERFGEGYTYRGGPGKDAQPDRKHPLMSELCADIPEDIDIFICHGPPNLGGLDCVKGKNIALGSEELAKKLISLPKLKHGFYGHIHSGNRTFVHGKTTHHNVSICDEGYRPVQPITIVDL